MPVAVDVKMQFPGKETAKERKKREAEEAKQARKELEEKFMMPYRDRPLERREFAVFDIESKKKDTDKAGFERPFLACFYDGRDYLTFRNDAKHKGRSWKERFWHDPGGCIDKLCKHIFGIAACEKCEIGEDDYRFGACEECVERRLRYTKKNWILTAHNGGNFDNLFILGWVRKHKKLFDCDIVNVQSRMLILTIRPRGKLAGKTKGEAWSFTDSIALIPLSLKEIGNTFCRKMPEAQKMDFDLNLPEDDEDWEEYNRRDCYVLHTALERFRKLIEKLGGTIGTTAASTALQLFRRKFQKVVIHRNMHFEDCTGRCERDNCPIISCRNSRYEDRVCHGCMHDFVREGFFGGRTEVFRSFGKRLFYYDINSSYPAAMRLEMPAGKAREMEGGTVAALRVMAQRYIGFVECVVEIPTDCYLPPLPYRLRKKSGEIKLVFPTGRLYGVWSWLEISEALKIGGKIVSIGKSVWYEKVKIFSKMIDTLYSYRQKICKVCSEDISKDNCKCPIKSWDAGLDYCAKLMMNSTFGKLGINPVREKLVFPDTMDDLDEDTMIPPPSLLGEAGIRKQHILDVDYICLAIPAWITAFARIILYRGLKSVLTRGGKIVYADTDSCLATMKVTPEGGKLGQWKLEKKNFDAEVLLPKTYLTREHEDDCRDETSCPGCKIIHKKDCGDYDCPGCVSPVTVKMKGIPRKLQNEKNWELLKKGNILRFDRLTMHRTMLNKKLSSPEEVEASKSMRSKYDKRKIMDARGRRFPEGNTKPLIINDPMTVADARRQRMVEKSAPPSRAKAA